MKYLIIGNGAAGTAAAQKLRQLDPHGEIAVLTGEGPGAYSKCLLADYLSGDYPEERLLFKSQDFYRDNRIELLAHHHVTAVHFETKTVSVAINNKPVKAELNLSYDKLLIASGGQPVIPPIPGIEKVKACFLNTLADAQEIRNHLPKARRVLIVGAGFVGLEAAFNLRKNGLAVTIVEKANRILPAQLDEVAAGIMGDGLKTEGIHVILNASLDIVRPVNPIKRRFSKDGALYEAVLGNGEVVGTDMFILATGSKPNLEFLKTGQLMVSRGILVDQYLRTSDPHVYAAGDVVESIDTLTGRHFLTPIWPNAVWQGECAAYNMTGHPKPLDRLIGMQNASEFREIPLISMGMVTANDPDIEEIVDYRQAKGIYRKILLKNDRIIGMIYLGDISQSGVIGALMKSQAPIGHLKRHFLEPNFGYGEIVKE